MKCFYGLIYKFRNQKLKMVLLTLMYTILFGVVLLLMVFSNSIKKQASFIESYIENEVTIMPTYKPIYEDTANEIKKLPCVNEYNVMCLHGIRLKDCVPVIKDIKLYNSYLEMCEKEAREVWKREFHPGNIPQARIIETNSTKNSAFFLDKGFYITKGRHIRSGDKNKAMISEEFAEENNLHLGDVVRTSTGKSDLAYYGHALDMELKVVGIYEHNKSSFRGSPQEYESNFIFTPLGPVSQTFKATYHRMTVYLKPGTSLEGLKKQLSEESLYINPNDYSISSSSEWSSILSEPLHNMQNMSRMLLALMMVCIIIIILLIGAFNVRGNLRNIGILLSIGVSERKVIFQLLAEECVPLLAGALLAFLIGSNGVTEVAKLVDHSYTSEMETVIAGKNEELLDNVARMEDSFNELQTRGQVMRMETNFKTEYSVNWSVFFAFSAVICCFLPVILGLQILYRIKHCSIKQILLS